MPRSRKPVEPAAPIGMSVVVFYECPNCHADVPYQQPTDPTFATCPYCGENFPIIPMDTRTLSFLRIMTAEGKAIFDPEIV